MIQLKNTNIALVDLVHLEVVSAFIQVLAPISNQVSIITNRFLYDKIDKSLLPINSSILCVDDESGNYIEEISRYLSEQKIEMLILTTIETGFGDFNKLFSVYSGKKLVVIHNVNFWFKRKRRLKIFREPRNEPHVQILDMTKKLDAVIVLDTGLIKSVRRYSKKVKIIPFSTALLKDEKSETSSFSDKMRIVVPGIIEKKRKDYHIVFELIKAIGSENVALTLLGKPRDDYGQLIINEARRLKTQGFDIEYFLDYIPAKKFNEEMEKATIVVSPIKPYVSFAGIPEEYGRTKISGSIYDIIRFKKPGIIPYELKLTAELKGRFIRYRNLDDLVAKVNSLMDKETYATVLDRITCSNEYWLEDNVRSRFKKDLLLNNLIDSY